MTEHGWGYVCVLLGLGAALYTAYGWRVGRIKLRSVSVRSEDPFGFWFSVVLASLWSFTVAGTGIYVVLR